MIEKNKLTLRRFFSDQHKLDKVFDYGKWLFEYHEQNAQDAIQEAAYNCMVSKKELPEDSDHLMHYIKVAVKNEYYKTLRKKVTTPKIEFTDSELKETPLMRKTQIDSSAKKIFNALKRFDLLIKKENKMFTSLEKGLWELIFHGLSNQQIALITGKSASTIATLRCKLIKKIQSKFQANLEIIKIEYQTSK